MFYMVLSLHHFHRIHTLRPLCFFFLFRFSSLHFFFFLIFFYFLLSSRHSPTAVPLGVPHHLSFVPMLKRCSGSLQLFLVLVLASFPSCFHQRSRWRIRRDNLSDKAEVSCLSPSGASGPTHSRLWFATGAGATHSADET